LLNDMTCVLGTGIWKYQENGRLVDHRFGKVRLWIVLSRARTTGQ
jgi:hypothetical protein